MSVKPDRKSTRLNSSHTVISYAVFCLKKKMMTSMAVVLVLIFFFSSLQVLSLCFTFIAAALSIALATPIQMLMIRTATEGELIGAAATQAAFNIGNALGALFGGWPIAAGLGYNSPSLVGACMAMAGIVFARILWRMQQKTTYSFSQGAA